VLKKAGIVVAATAAGLLSISPLAFAGDSEDDKRHHHGSDKNINRVDERSRTEQKGFLNVSADNLAVSHQDCNNEISQTIDKTIDQTIPQKLGPLAGLLGFLRFHPEQTAIAHTEQSAYTPIECYNSAEAGDVIEQEVDD
jgi:hypothetical protein